MAYNASPLNLTLISFLDITDNFQSVIGTLMDFLVFLHSSGGLSANQTQDFHSLSHPRRCQFCFILWLWCLTTQDLSGCNFRSIFFFLWSHSQSPAVSFYLNSVASCRSLLTLLATWLNAQPSLWKGIILLKLSYFHNMIYIWDSMFVFCCLEAKLNHQTLTVITTIPWQFMECL